MKVELTSNGLGWSGASNGVEPNRSWLADVLFPLRRGIEAFGGGATKTVESIQMSVHFSVTVERVSDVLRKGGELWLLEMPLVIDVLIPLPF